MDNMTLTYMNKCIIFFKIYQKFSKISAVGLIYTKYVRRIWQLRQTIEKYVVNVRRGRRISYTLK